MAWHVQPTSSLESLKCKGSKRTDEFSVACTRLVLGRMR